MRWFPRFPTFPAAGIRRITAGRKFEGVSEQVPTEAFIIYPDKKSYIGINAYDWLDDEKLYVYVSQEEELAPSRNFL